MLRWFLFNLWYFGRPPWESGIVPPEVQALIRRLPPARALDLGCGTGTSSLALARAGWQVTGVDYAWRAIRLARRKAKQAGLQVDFRNASVTRLKGLAGPFDLVLDIGCFHGLDPAARAVSLAHLTRLLAPGGHWFLYAFTCPGPAEPAAAGLSPADLEQIRAGFTLLSRQDGLDGRRTSAYFLFQARPIPTPPPGTI